VRACLWRKRTHGEQPELAETGRAALECARSTTRRSFMGIANGCRRPSAVLAESKGGRPLCCADGLNGRITHRPKIRPRGLRRQSRQLSSCTTCLSRLCGRCGLAHGAAAIGAGTGTATRRLLDLGANPLVAIEPDARFATFLRETIEDRALIEHRVKAWQLVLDPDQTVALYATYSNINIRRDCERSSLSWVASLATSSTVA
jgi:hypothetical protein